MQARDVTFSVAGPDVDIVGGFPDGPVTPPSLTWVAPSPASGATGVASGNFIATLLHGTASVTVTPSSDKAGTWAPTSRTLTPEAATGNFTFTASEAGFHSVTLTNDAGISAPAAVTFTATEVPALAFVAPDTATAGVTITGTITASGAASGPWSLNVPSGWTVSPSSGASVAPGSPVTINVTATEGTQSLTLTCSGATITGNPQSIVVSAAGGGLTVGAQVYTLAATNLSGSGSRPFSATVLPLRGAVPSGERLTDSTGAFDSTVLSTHDDGSAAVVVVSGTASGTGTLNLHRATGSTTALTAAAIGALVTSVEVAFGAPYGTASLTDFSTPERTWWANSKTICARYRVAAPTPGSTALEAVIDVHAWAGRALVEVTVENCKMNPASPVKPAAASYSAAVVSVNGSTVATVNGNAAPEGNHAAFRSWYASAWVGGDPGLRVTQARADLQQHPLLFKCDQAATFDMAGYASDAYTPWTAGRQRATNMGGTGDHPSIGPLPQWEARFLQSGDYRAAKATEVSALAVLGFNINYRDSATGLVPTFAAIGTKAIAAGTWPVQQPGGGSGSLEWEVAHSPAAGLMAFISRPSPVFIEIAQKVATWNGAWSSDATPGWTAGTFGYWYQLRGRAWGMRSLAHAAFLTPAGDAWRTSALTAISNNVTYLSSFTADSKAKLNTIWDYSVAAPRDFNSGVSGFQNSEWQVHYLTAEVHKAASVGLLSGASQTALNALADWLALGPVRFVNEQAGGGWRYIPYETRIGDAVADAIGSTTSWDTSRGYSDSPSGATGTWMSNGGSPLAFSTFTADTTAGAYYPSYFWSALMAAYERGVSGADTAVDTVVNGITDLTTWRAGFGSDPRWGAWPKGYVSLGWDTGAGTGSIVGNLWAPALGPASKVNAASWATLQVGRVSGNLRAYRIAGTRLDGLDTPLKATMLSTYGAAWEDVGVSRWAGLTDAWVGLVWDDRAGRERAFIGPGGGHAASGNNGMYMMDVRAFGWSVKSLPTPPTLVTANDVYPVGYQGDTNYPRYTGPYSSPYAGVWADEIFDPSNPTDPVKSSRKPTSRHTYGMQAFRPDLGAEGTIYMLCRRAWKFDVAAGTWSTPVALNGVSDPGTFSSAENGFCWWDEVGGYVYLCGNNLSSSPDSRSCRWDGGSTWSTAGYYPTGGYPLASAQFEKRGRIIHHLQYAHTNAGAPDNRPSKPLHIKQHDLDAGTATTINITFGGDLASATWGLDYQVDYWDVGSITYVEPLAAYLIVIRRQGFGDELAWVDEATGVCTLATDITGDFGPVYRTEGKIKYVESIGAILHGTSADQEWGVIRVV